MVGFAEGAVGGFEIVKGGDVGKIIGLHGTISFSFSVSKYLFFHGKCATMESPGGPFETGGFLPAARGTDSGA